MNSSNNLIQKCQMRYNSFLKENKLVDKIVKVNLFKSKSDDNISKKSQNKELKNVIEEDKDKKPKSCEKKKK